MWTFGATNFTHVPKTWMLICDLTVVFKSSGDYNVYLDQESGYCLYQHNWYENLGIWEPVE